MFNFVSISNLNTSKGTFVLLDAAKLLLKQASDFHVHFVGAPTAEISEERMHREIESRGLQQVVTYHGCQYGEDKESRFAEADCFVHPTLDDCFPLVILEAMQHSLPVIATPVGAIPDMVIDGETGILVHANDAHALEGAMSRLIENVHLAAQYGETGKSLLQRHYTSNVFEEKLISILAK